MFECALCSSKAFQRWRLISGYSLNSCVNCGLLQTQTSEAQRLIYNKNKYSEQYANNYKKELPKLYKRFSKQIAIIKQYCHGGKLLDVGCGTGHFIKYLRDHDDSWKVFGVEPNRLLRNFARKISGASIVDGRLDKIPFPNNYFDVITCYDVLEHSMTIRTNILELKRVMKPNGLLFIQAPNYKSIMAKITRDSWDWWCIPDHVFHFSYEFLSKLMRNFGFNVLKGYTYEDKEDFLSNVKSIFKGNYLLKVVYILSIPFLLVLEHIGWLINQGGLIVIIARK